MAMRLATEKERFDRPHRLFGLPSSRFASTFWINCSDTLAFRISVESATGEGTTIEYADFLNGMSCIFSLCCYLCNSSVCRSFRQTWHPKDPASWCHGSKAGYYVDHKSNRRVLNNESFMEMLRSPWSLGCHRWSVCNVSIWLKEEDGATLLYTTREEEIWARKPERCQVEKLLGSSG